uniref:anthocyanidin 3-O-glucosyltransferase n=1 Tax=Rhizophora mucronata TaxID=61149 RepID=A0A2P2Q701_RHIMU
MPPPHELAELAEALEASGFPFLWSIKENPEEKLPNGFLERTKEKGKIVSWTPQVKVLQHKATGVFMTHSGWNSILESIIGKVPMICRPFFGDQHLNTRIIEAVWEAGVGIKGAIIRKDATIEALNLILSTEEGDKMREKLGALKELALDAVKSDGSSAENFKDLVEIVTK